MNKKTKMLIQAIVFTCAASGLAANSANALNYPDHPIKLVVPYPAGAAVDNVGRMLASALSEKLDQTIIVENRDGAASQIGSAHVAKAKPDGYTLLLTTLDALTLLPHVKKNLPYDPMADFQDIARIARVPYTIQSNPKLGFKSLSDLVNAAKAEPDTLKYGSTGNGSLAHVAMEMLSNQADIKLIHVPYRGMSASLNDLIAGHIDLAMVSAATIAPYVKTEKVQTLSLASAQKNAMWPEIPPTTESGITGVEAQLEFLVTSPAGTPPEIVNVISKAINSISQEETFRENLQKQGLEPAYMDAVSLLERRQNDSRNWKQVIAQSGIEKE